MSRRKTAPKTLAMRVLDGQGIAYDVIVFPPAIHDALGVAEHAGIPPQQVYKTLVVEPEQTGLKPVLIMVAADRELNLKKVADALGVKRVRMARQADAERITGLQVGGISALALLNKGLAVYIDRPAADLEYIVVSAGQRGLNLHLRRDDLVRVTGARTIDASDG